LRRYKLCGCGMRCARDARSRDFVFMRWAVVNTKVGPSHVIIEDKHQNFFLLISSLLHGHQPTSCKYKPQLHTLFNSIHHVTTVHSHRPSLHQHLLLHHLPRLRHDLHALSTDRLLPLRLQYLAHNTGRLGAHGTHHDPLRRQRDFPGRGHFRVNVVWNKEERGTGAVGCERVCGD
jgi:hypothetical protein